MYPNVEGIINRIKSYIERERNSSKFILETLSPPAGPYALFHHHGHFLERLENVSSILERMGLARYRISVLNERFERREPKTGIKPGKPYSEYLQKISREEHKLTGLMRLDNESLYIFGNMALDQWSFNIAYSLGLKNPDKYDFQYLIMQLQAKKYDPKLKPFIDRHFKDAIWLYYQLKFYRNNFIEHVRRPWQRGSTMSVYGDDFNFFIPTPTGWISDEKQVEMIRPILHLAPDAYKRLPDNDWQKKPRALLEAIFKNIDSIESQVDRENVWNVWKEIGGSVISFHILSNRLIKFLDESSVTLTEEVEKNPQNINLGESPYKRKCDK
jgi:hypothetical protein